MTICVNTKKMGKEKSSKRDQIVAAACKVFAKYGFRRVTMAELAEAAQMSRPALYLEFESKEDIFKAVVDSMSRQNLDEIRQGLPRLKSLDEKLEFAFELWFVRPFELVQASPDAADIFDSVKEFAFEVISKAAAEFEDLLVEIIDPTIRKQKSMKLSSRKVARMMRASAKGFKNDAKNAKELRELISDMRQIVLASF